MPPFPPVSLQKQRETMRNNVKRSSFEKFLNQGTKAEPPSENWIITGRFSSYGRSQIAYFSFWTVQTILRQIQGVGRPELGRFAPIVSEIVSGITHITTEWQSTRWLLAHNDDHQSLLLAIAHYSSTRAGHSSWGLKSTARPGPPCRLQALSWWCWSLRSRRFTEGRLVSGAEWLPKASAGAVECWDGVLVFLNRKKIIQHRRWIQNIQTSKIKCVLFPKLSKYYKLVISSHEIVIKLKLRCGAKDPAPSHAEGEPTQGHLWSRQPGCWKNGVRYCTVHPNHWLLRWKHFFGQLDVGGFSWMLMMFRKSGVWCSGIPLFPTLAMPSSLELPRTTCLPQLTKLREGASLWAKPAAVSNPQTAANKLDNSSFLPEVPAVAACPSRCWLRGKRLQCDLFALVMFSILFYSVVFLTAALIGQCDLAGSAFTALTSCRIQFEFKLNVPACVWKLHWNSQKRENLQKCMILQNWWNDKRDKNDGFCKINETQKVEKTMVFAKSWKHQKLYLSPPGSDARQQQWTKDMGEYKAEKQQFQTMVPTCKEHRNLFCAEI